MLADINKYRGFDINVEMNDGQFVPSLHDPLNHQVDQWERMPKCQSETQDGALRLAHKQIDERIEWEMQNLKSVTYGTFNLRETFKMLESAGEPFYGLSGGTQRFMEAYSCNLDPDYQRGHVWTLEQQEKFMGHVLEGGWTAPCIVNTGPRGDWLYSDVNNVGMSEVLDGKQRITAALLWEKGEIAALLSDGTRVKTTDMSKMSRNMLSNTVGLRYKIVNLSRAEALYWYIRLNRGGTVHTDAEIDRVRQLLKEETSK